MASRVRLWCFALAVLLAVAAPSNGTSWTEKDLRQYDNIRLSREAAEQSETKDGSNVVRVVVPPGTMDKNTTTIENPGDVLRLCHIASMVGSTIRGKRFTDSYYSQQAILLAMLHFNNKIDTVVPDLTTDPTVRDCDVKLTIDFFDTKMSSIIASAHFFEDILNQNHTLASPQPCAILGAGLSAVSGQISVASSTFDIPMIAGVSMASELDNKDRYPLLGRMIPADTTVAVAAVRYFKEILNVTHCGILYVRDNWGRGMNRLFTNEARSHENDMVVTSASFDPLASEESIKTAMDQLSNSGFNYFFVAASPKAFKPILSYGGKSGVMGPGRYWLFSPVSADILRASYKFDSDQIDAARAADGIGVITINVPLKETFVNAWSDFETDAALMDYFVSKQPTHLNLSQTEFQSVPFYWYQFRYDAVIALGIAACHAKSDFFGGNQLFQAFKEVDFMGATGRVRVNADTGSRSFTAMSYKVTNVAARKPNEFNEIYFDSAEVGHQVMLKERMQWIQTSVPIFANKSTQQPLNLPPASVTVVKISRGALGFGLCLGWATMLESLCWVVWAFRYRRTRVVRSAQPEFLYILCVGTLVMSSAVIPLSLQKPVSQRGLDVSCMAVPWLCQIGFIISFSALLAKMMRINKIFLSGSFRRVVVKPRDVMLPMFFLLLASLVLLTAWTILKPLTYQTFSLSQDQFGRPIEVYSKCSVQNSNHLLPFVIPLVTMNVGLLCFANFQAYRARNIRCDFSESRYIAVSMASILQAFILGVPVFVAVLAAGNPSGSFIVTAILVTLLCSAVLLPMFIPKVVALKRAPGENTQTKEQPGVRVYLTPPNSREIALSREDVAQENCHFVGRGKQAR